MVLNLHISCLNYKTEGRLPGYWNRRGPLESVRKTSQPPGHGSNHISRCAPHVLGGTWDRYLRPRSQADPTTYFHEVGGPLRGISGSPEGLRRLRPGKVPGISCGVQGWSQDASTSLDVLGPTEHSGQGRRVLWMPIKRVPMCDARRPPVPYNFQRGRGCSHSPLSDGGDSSRGGHGRTWSDNHRPGGILLC